MPGPARPCSRAKDLTSTTIPRSRAARGRLESRTSRAFCRKIAAEEALLFGELGLAFGVICAHQDVALLDLGADVDDARSSRLRSASSATFGRMSLVISQESLVRGSTLLSLWSRG